jgi:hypothetical protein
MSARIERGKQMVETILSPMGVSQQFSTIDEYLSATVERTTAQTAFLLPSASKQHAKYSRN